MEQTDFLHVDADSQKLNDDKKFIRWAWLVRSWNSKTDCVSKAEQMEYTFFLHAVTNSGKGFWVDLVKRHRGLVVHETLKSAVS